MNKYGQLLHDDPAYNKKYPAWIPASRIAIANVFNWALLRYVYKEDWARISTTTWKRNLTNGWVWDDDHFGTNFVGHPHTGNNYFNIARANGYSYWQTLPFTLGGSLMWEYFGENTSPSRNDIINTPLSGMFLGEVLYRLSSNVLDDRTTGGQRVFREIFAGLLNPPRALNRLSQGKMFRVTSKEVYQKEPLNITITGGVHRINEGKSTNNYFINAAFNLQLDYGDAFEVRPRKPLDVFRLRTESSFGIRKKILGSAVGYGLLFGKNVLKSRHGLLMGIFQNYDYWNNRVFEMGSLGFGPGLISRIPFSKNSVLYSSLHLAGVPLAGNNISTGPDTSLFRDYHFGGGMEAKVEETFHLGKLLTLGFNGYYYWIHQYEGIKGKSLVGILRPRVVLNLFRNTSIGFEHQAYYNKRFLNNHQSLYVTRNEQKVFLQLFFQDKNRKDRYQ
jgi:hypothetical protein